MAQVKAHTRKTKKGPVRVRSHARINQKKVFARLDKIEELIDARLEKLETKIKNLFRDIEDAEETVDRKIYNLDERLADLEP